MGTSPSPGACAYHTHSCVGSRVNICVEQEEAVPLRRVLVGVDGLSCGPRSQTAQRRFPLFCFLLFSTFLEHSIH